MGGAGVHFEFQSRLDDLDLAHEDKELVDFESPLS
jgi:hypothetical protein